MKIAFIYKKHHLKFEQIVIINCYIYLFTVATNLLRVSKTFFFKLALPN